MAANKNQNDTIAIACGLNPRYPGKPKKHLRRKVV